MGDLSTYSDDQLAQIAGVPVSDGAPAPLHAAILGQESGNNSNVGTSTDGAVGPGQITPDTWKQYAQPYEDINDPDDNRAVSGRIIDHLHDKFGGDPARVAVGYFSGPGNVAPAGSPTPWKNDVTDGNGKKVSSYVGDVLGRLGSAVVGDAQAATPASPQAPVSPPAQAPGAPAPAQSDDTQTVPPSATMSDDDLAKIAGVQIDPRMPKSGEGFWGYQGRQFARPFHEMADSVRSGAQDLEDLVTPSKWNPENWQGPASNKMSGDVVGGNWSSVPRDVLDAFNEKFAANPAIKLMSGPGKIALAPAAPLLNSASDTLESLGLPKDVQQFGMNIAPLLLKGAKAGGKATPPEEGAPIPPNEGSGGPPPPPPPGGSAPPVSPEAPGTTGSPPAGGGGSIPPEEPPPGGSGGAETPPKPQTPEEAFNEQHGPAPASLMTMDSGKPLLINQRSIRKGVGDLQEFLDKDGVDLNETADKLQALKKVDPNATALDAIVTNMTKGNNGQWSISDTGVPTGSNALGLAKSIAQGPGQGRALANELVGRGYQARGEISGQIDNLLSGSDYAQKLQAARQAKMDSGQAFEQAYAVPNPMSDRLQNSFLNQPEIKQGLKEGLQLERLDAATNHRTFDPADYSVTGTDAEGNPTTAPSPNMKMLAAAKRGLDSMIEKEQDKVTGTFTPKGKSLIGFKNAYQGELYRLNPKYKTANDLFSTPASIESHLRMGKNIDTMKVRDVENIMKNDKISAADKEAFASGAGDQIIHKLGQAPTTTNPINSIMTDNFKERMQALAPNKAAYQKFMDAMNLHKSKALVNNIVTGSPTYANEAFSNKPVSTMTGHAIRLAADPLAAAGNMLGNIADKALQKSAMKMSEDSRTVAQRVLTTKDPNLLRYAARKAGK